MYHDPGLGTVGLDADGPGENRLLGEAPAKHGQVIEAVQQRQHERWIDGDPCQGADRPAALVATKSASTCSVRLRDCPRTGHKSPKVTLWIEIPRRR